MGGERADGGDEKVVEAKNPRDPKQGVGKEALPRKTRITRKREREMRKRRDAGDEKGDAGVRGNGQTWTNTNGHELGAGARTSAERVELMDPIESRGEHE